MQRILTLEAELTTGVLPAELKVTVDSFVPIIGHDDTAGGPDWTDSWQSRMTVVSLTQHRMLGPYADVVLLFGPVLHEDMRTDPGGRPMLVAETLAAWASSGELRRAFVLRIHAPAAAVARGGGAQRTRSADRAVGVHHDFPRHAA